MEKSFYVYEWYNIDTNEVFYVGKGTGKRYLETKKRNQRFLNYMKNNTVTVRKVYENLSEKEAFEKEKILTAQYKKIGQCQCCLAAGGTGGKSSVWTPEFKQYWSENNPMKEEKQRERMRTNNPMHDNEVALRSGAKHKRAVIIDGQFYPGVIDAAKELKVRDVTIIAWCKKGYNSFGKPCRYADEEQKEFQLPKKGRGVIIDECDYYSTLKEAALALGAKDSSPLCKALKNNKTYKGHKCRYADQQPSQENSN